MTIPTSFADYMLSFHCVKARKDILKYTCFNVVSSWHSISCWGALIKHPSRCAFTGRNSFFENLVIAPELQYRVFDGRQIYCCWNCAKRHKKSSTSRTTTLEGRDLLAQISRYHPPCVKFTPLHFFYPRLVLDGFHHFF